MNVVYAVATAVVTMPNGGEFRITAGTHWPAGDPVVLQQPTLFSTDPSYGLHYSTTFAELTSSTGDVEQATASPGERRRVGRG